MRGTDNRPERRRAARFPQAPSVCCEDEDAGGSQGENRQRKSANRPARYKWNIGNSLSTGRISHPITTTTRPPVAVAARNSAAVTGRSGRQMTRKLVETAVTHNNGFICGLLCLLPEFRVLSP